MKMDKSQYKDVYVFVEQREGVIQKVAIELLGKARELADSLNEKVVAMLLGYEVAPISRASTGRTAGRPVRASRPLASITEAVSGGMADPMDFLMLSAMRVPMIRLYLVRR